MTARRYKVLFLCTGNSARSIMAESILRRDGRGRFEAFSAGSQPKSAVNPLALEALEHLGYPTDGLRSKSWEEFAGQDAPKLDLVITVCDNAAGEACPVWPGQPTRAHWGIEDPAAAEGPAEQQRAAFLQALRFLHRRISLLLSLPIASLDKLALESELAAIGRESGATETALSSS